jgi:hypothetical protein
MQDFLIAKVGEIGARPPDRLYTPMLQELRRHRSGSLRTDLTEWLPGVAIRMYEANIATMQRVLAYRNPVTKSLDVSPIRSDGKPIYWDGKWFTETSWPGAERAWVDDYATLATKVAALVANDPASQFTTIDLGSGFGGLIFQIALKLRDAGLQDTSFCAIDIDHAALEFVATFAKRHHIDVQCVQMDLRSETSRQRSSWSDGMKASGRKKIVVTRSGLFTLYTDDQYDGLFRFLIDEVGITAGAHIEYLGFKTPTYHKIIRAFTTTPRISATWTECTSDPYGFLRDNADRLGIAITEHVEIWPHFPCLALPLVALWPSYLAWAVKDLGAAA